MTKTILSILFSISFLLLTVGCGTTGPKFEKVSPDVKTSLIYIYRPSKIGGSAADPEVFIDGKKLLALTNGGYQILKIAPGSHTISIKRLFWSIDEQVSFISKPGQSYYLRFEMLESSGDRSTSMGVNGLSGSMIVSEFKDGMIKDFSIVVDRRVSDLKSFNPRAFFVTENFAEKEIVKTNLIRD